MTIGGKQEIKDKIEARENIIKKILVSTLILIKYTVDSYLLRPNINIGNIFNIIEVKENDIT